jgi:hypothetical protein
VKKTRLLGVFLAWHRLAHNFHLAGRGPNGQVILACGHLRADGRCGIYRWRPLLCRNYPAVPFFDPPPLLPGCGFHAVPRVVVQMKDRPSLPIVNPQVAVHHPSPPDPQECLPEHFELVELTARPDPQTHGPRGSL